MNISLLAGVHRVRNGENLTLISKKYQVPLSELISQNKLTNVDNIYVGQSLKIPNFTKKMVVSIRRPNFYDPLRTPTLRKNYDSMGDFRNYGYLYSTNSKAPVKAAAAGKVVKIANLRGYGRYVVVDHGNGWTSLYSKMGILKIQIGSWVNRGSLLGSIEKNQLFFLIAYRGKPLNPSVFLRG